MFLLQYKNELKINRVYIQGIKAIKRPHTDYIKEKQRLHKNNINYEHIKTIKGVIELT